jgi:hypothetical protein
MRRQLDVGRQTRFVYLGRNRRSDYSGAVPVARIVLDNQHRPKSALLAAHNGAEVGVIDLSSFDIHAASLSDEV